MRHRRRRLSDSEPGPGSSGGDAVPPEDAPRRSLPVVLLAPLLLAALLLPAACGGEPDGGSADPHRELRARLNLDADREVHRIALGGRGAEEHVAPTRLNVGPSAVVEFLTVDGRIHTVSFPEDSLPLDAVLFLRRTSQLRSPPLVDRGSRFVLDFEDAPSARYRFLSEGPGGEAWGVIVVGEPTEAPPEG